MTERNAQQTADLLQNTVSALARSFQETGHPMWTNDAAAEWLQSRGLHPEGFEEWRQYTMYTAIEAADGLDTLLALFGASIGAAFQVGYAIAEAEALSQAHT